MIRKCTAVALLIADSDALEDDSKFAADVVVRRSPLLLLLAPATAVGSICLKTTTPREDRVL